MLKADLSQRRVTHASSHRSPFSVITGTPIHSASKLVVQPLNGNGSSAIVDSVEKLQVPVLRKALAAQDQALGRNAARAKAVTMRRRTEGLSNQFTYLRNNREFAPPAEAPPKAPARRRSASPDC